jgi:outer membrane protein OmpA-like peptidoglycan-associated protein
MIRFAVLLSFLLLPVLVAVGQVKYSTTSKKAIKLYEEAELMLRQRRFSEAIARFKGALEKDNDFIEAHLRLAFSYEILRESNEQQYHLEQVIRLAPNSVKYKNVYYSLGKVYFNQGRYEPAGELLDKLQNFGIDSERMRKDVIDLQRNINFAIEHIQKPIDIKPLPMPDVLNSFPLQYFPVLTADEQTIIYTSRDGVTFHDDENIVISTKDEGGNWQSPVGISPNINSQFNEGTCTISADGRTLIFTNCEGRPGLGSCDLFISYRTGDEWSVPENLGKNVNSMSWDSQPSLSADGRKLYLISDRAGGMGKRDIWMSVKDRNNQWGKAVNLGRPVNSPEDEVSPFIHVNGTTLFYSSTGFPGFGGFDLYKSEWSDSAWSEPVNLGYPLNTHEDQVSLFVSTNGKRGYYSYERINREGQKESLLYYFNFPSEGILNYKSIYLTGHVYDIETSEPIGATIELYLLGESEPLSIFNSDPETGEYFSILSENTKIALYVERPGYLFESQTFEINAGFDDQIRKDIYLQPIREGNLVRLNNIFFELNSASLTEESVTELLKISRFLLENPGVKIKIAGHTDDLGSDDYNLQLSERRARAVYDFLIKQNIHPDFLTYAGYGETRPLEENRDEKSRSLNRRIEFYIDGPQN